MLRVIANLINEIGSFEFAVAYALYGGENRKFVGQAFGFEHDADLVRGRGSLKFLAAQKFVLEGFDGLKKN